MHTDADADSEPAQITQIVTDCVDVSPELVERAGLATAAELRVAPVVARRSTISAFGTVAESLFLGHEIRRFGIVRREQQATEAGRLLALVGVDREPSSRVENLTAAESALLSCAQALVRRTPVVFVDAARAASLDDPRIGSALGLLADSGTRVFVLGAPLAAFTHIAQRIVAVKDGRVAGSVVATEPEGLGETDLENVLDLLVASPEHPSGGAAREQGQETEREREQKTGPVRDREPGSSVTHRFVVDAWTVAPPLGNGRNIATDVSLTANGGETLVLIGEGSTELLASLFARSFGRHVGGTVAVDDVQTDTLSVERSIHEGVVFGSEHPMGYEVSAIGGITTRVTSGSLARLAKAGVVDARREYVAARTVTRGLAGRQGPAQFSAVLEGWATARESGTEKLAVTGARVPRVVLLDQPFEADRERRITAVRRLAASGAAVVLSTGSVDDALSAADRVLVVRDGRIADECRRSGCSEAVRRELLRSLLI
ncbi:sugar ABC transporter ATP-binding protein [Okibacterium endophyticum]